ncbi:MAG: FliM/FliN family flagellar motor C-terminal domain-containing protein [Phycisphaerae bacterium]|nr:FliM/FliN family flagellar motor C-terminal domain-containing protein [Phycisphaerae bacterium]
MAKQTNPESPEADAAVAVQEPTFTELPPTAAGGGGGQIDILLETAMPVAVRVGEIDVPVKQLLQWTPGMVISLNKTLGEPVDLYLRGVRFATGHLVVVNNQIGVRIKEILNR